MIDFRESGQLLYVSSADVSIGNGPGVNEREFILALHRVMGDRADFLIPQPAHEVSDLPHQACTFCAPHHRHRMRHYPVHILSQMRLAKQLMAERRFDMLVFRLDILPITPWYITRKSGIPFALKTLGQNAIKSLAERGGWIGRSLVGINRSMVRHLVGNAIVADSVSPLQIGFLRENLAVAPDKIVWIDNAVNTERFFPRSAIEARRKLGLSHFDSIVGYVGTRPWERGGSQLIEATARLVEKHPRLGAVILGDGKGLDGMRRRAAALNIRDHCVFAGYVPFHDVPDYVNALDVGASINLRYDRQASSELKVRQYLACGKPVLASPGGNDFLVEADLGSIVPPTAIDAITVELDRWLSLSAAERESFADRACDYVTRHLSIYHAMDARFDLWKQRLRAEQTGCGQLAQA